MAIDEFLKKSLSVWMGGIRRLDDCTTEFLNSILRERLPGRGGAILFMLTSPSVFSNLPEIEEPKDMDMAAAAEQLIQLSGDEENDNMITSSDTQNINRSIHVLFL